MPYIGRDTDKLSNIEVLDNITFDGSSSYTLQKGGSNFTPSSANNILISIDGVVQAGNFTVSSSTIDFGTAVAGTSTCDFILHYGIGLITTPSDGTVTTAKLADSSVSLAKLTATGTKDATTFLRGDNTFAEPVAGGITMADQWRLTTNFSGSGDITTNLERADSLLQGNLGTGMTESSGIFTFPSTGYYHIIGTFELDGAVNNSYMSGEIYVTNDNSNYSLTALARGGIAGNTGSDDRLSTTCFSLLDITNVSLQKVKFRIDNSGGVAVGGSSYNRTHFTFIRLGDT